MNPHLVNAENSMVFKLEPKEMLLRFEQSWNAAEPMVSTVSGSVTVLRMVLPGDMKADGSITVNGALKRMIPTPLLSLGAMFSAISFPVAAFVVYDTAELSVVVYHISLMPCVEVVVEEIQPVLRPLEMLLAFSM